MEKISECGVFVIVWMGLLQENRYQMLKISTDAQIIDEKEGVCTNLGIAGKCKEDK